MSELKEEKLLEKLNKAFEYLPLSIANGQAHRQIKEIVKLHFSDDWQQVKKELGKFMQEQKPRVTEEFIEKWSMYCGRSSATIKQMLKEAGVEIK